MTTHVDVETRADDKVAVIQSSLGQNRSSAPTSTGLQLSQEIERLSLNHVNSFTTRSIATDAVLLGITSPDLKGNFDDMPAASTGAAHLSMIDAIARQHPNWKVEIMNSCIGIEEGPGVATVWITLGVSGIPQEGFEDVKRESVYIITWKRVQDGRWLMIEQRNVRGPGRSSF
ncbi:hypothetical protein LTR62_004815 [Meristemomyces frigidus]|uniref:Uncharacterized protein n=1 Tax=Meristemomyces frigidus TaxID=1508187 RepID=A0AAN7TFS5_9PEZI|nr:hypothetical protein LTR62_004815 [Meristemomyces frigidus]